MQDAYSFKEKGMLDFSGNIPRPQALADLDSASLQDLLAQIFNDLPTAVAIKDAKTFRYLIFNKAAEALSGKHRDEVIDKTDFMAFPENAEDYIKNDKRLLDGCLSIDVSEETLGTPFGLKVLHTKRSCIRDISGNPKFIIGLSEDVTERKKLENELMFLSDHDALTSLDNRRALQKCLDNELVRASRYHHDVSIFLIDIDYFKSINDAFGHLVGDEVLKSFSDLLKHTVRYSDYVSRYGGEEFVIVLPETPLSEALELAERLRNNIYNHVVHIDDGSEHKITASIGVASFPQHAECLEKLLSIADSAMYLAKESGRNQVKSGSLISM
jgi:diguanylate cyclase (GGDEF)-like protein/PAS domain S-box-containing protein